MAHVKETRNGYILKYLKKRNYLGDLGVGGRIIFK